jgi:hypothetical protein
VLTPSLEAKHILFPSEPKTTPLTDDQLSQTSKASEHKTFFKSGVSDKPTMSSNIMDMLEASKVPLEVIMNLLETDVIPLNGTLPKLTTEETFVRMRFLLLRELRKIMDEKRLTPVTSLDIPPDSQVTVFLIYTPESSNKPYIQVMSLYLLV